MVVEDPNCMVTERCSTGFYGYYVQELVGLIYQTDFHQALPAFVGLAGGLKMVYCARYWKRWHGIWKKWGKSIYPNAL